MESNNVEWEIIHPSEEYTEDLARFNTEMAWETEGKKLIKETITSGCRNLILQPKFGSFFTAIQDKKAIGNLLTTYEYNVALYKPIYWIQSVFVEKSHRGKGVFKSLFNKAINEARSKKIYSVKLYVEKTNEKAKEVYQKLGMSNNDQEIYEMDFGFGDHKFILPDGLINESFKANKLIQGDLSELSKLKTKHLLGTVNADELIIDAFDFLLKNEVSGDVVVIREGDKIVGVVSAFTEWSDWRDKVMYWVYDIKISNEISQEKYPEYLKIFLKMAYDQLGGDSMGAYRVNFKDGSSQAKQAMLEIGLEESHYYVYEIKTS